MEIKPIAVCHTGFTQKFGIPRQSNLVESAKGTITFLDEYTNPDYIKGIEDFEYLWLIFGFSKSYDHESSPLVRPPRLGGNIYKGVFATRAPYRPNNLGLSSVRLESVEYPENGSPILHISGMDLLDGTPIFDIKPYIAYGDSHPNASGGWALTDKKVLSVVFPEEYLCKIPDEIKRTIIELLEADPRPAYDKSSDRDFKLNYDGFDITFISKGDILEVTDVTYSLPSQQ